MTSVLQLLAFYNHISLEWSWIMSRLISICFCQSKRGILNSRLLKLNTPLFLSLPSSLPSPFPSFPHSFLPSFQTHWYYGFRKENSMSISLWFNFSDDIFFSSHLPSGGKIETCTFHCYSFLFCSFIFHWLHQNKPWFSNFCRVFY